MPLTIGHLTTEVMTEPDGRGPADTGVTGPDVPEQQRAVKRAIAVIVRNEMRTRAEGFDD
jgi:hypothetical protein